MSARYLVKAEGCWSCPFGYNRGRSDRERCGHPAAHWYPFVMLPLEDPPNEVEPPPSCPWRHPSGSVVRIEGALGDTVHPGAAVSEVDDPPDGCTGCGEAKASTEDEHGNAVCSACASALAWAASRGIELTPAELRAYGRGWRAEKG